ncbi:hypothetical protein M8J76_001030 [Diaphorina citri]|nr:hypothetical protein M8J75_011186 [Diaphorina citri]KAI5726346.1 hypothetical protein M8J76_001030 [Diaphorina citri]KAI5731106.1 hypothetical protein M8J77_004754 [Diaphorina citri]
MVVGAKMLSSILLSIIILIFNGIGCEGFSSYYQDDYSDYPTSNSIKRATNLGGRFNLRKKFIAFTRSESKQKRSFGFKQKIMNSAEDHWWSTM